MEIGFIGLGRMGANMVCHPPGGQHRVVVWSRKAAKTQDIVSESNMVCIRLPGKASRF